MSSPPTHNVLRDPLTELRLSLEAYSFGIKQWTLLADQSFPATEAERAEVVRASEGDAALAKVHARARIVLLDDEGEVDVVLDPRGFTVDTQGQSRTFEALDALLIAISPAYVASMQDELHKRLADTERRWEHEELDEPEWID